MTDSKQFTLKENFRFLILLLTYRIVLDCSYVFIISPLYSYSGLTVDINTGKLFISYAIMFFIGAILDRSKNKASSIILQYHFIIMIIPVLSYYALNNKPLSFVLMATGCFILEIVLLRHLRNFRIIRITQLKTAFSIGLLTFLLFTVFAMLKSNGLSISAFNFSIIYKIRDQIVFPAPVFTYFWTWCYRIINPFFIVMAYVKKKRLPMALFLGLQIIMYLIFPHKEILFAPFLILGCIYFIKRFNFSNSILLVLSIIILSFVAIYHISGQVMPVAIIPNRLLIIPAQGKFEHFEYFSKFTKLYFSEGIIGRIFNIPYPYGNISSGNVIALYCQGTIGSSNAGYSAYAFDNLGFAGMLLESLVFVIIMKYFDSVADFLDVNIVTSLCIYPFALLNDGDIFTMLLTGGLFVLMLVLPVYGDSFTKSQQTSTCISQPAVPSSRYFKSRQPSLKYMRQEIEGSASSYMKKA